MVYFGTPYFSAIFLERLINDKSIPVEVKLVVTQPDRHAGRKQVLTPSPVKNIAVKYGLPTIHSLTAIHNTPGVKQIDMAFLFAYGDILSRHILTIPKFGFWNTHPSLLPLYRGAAPIAMPLILGDKKTGVTLIQLDEEIDHGPIITQEELKISQNDRRPDLEVKLTDLAFEMFRKAILNLVEESEDTHFERLGMSAQSAEGPTGVKNSVSNFPKSNEQNHAKATFTRLISKNDGFIPLEILKKALSDKVSTEQFKPKIIEDYYKINPHSRKSAENTVRTGQCPVPTKIYNLFRGLYPWPGIWTQIQPKRLNMGYEDSLKRLKITDIALLNDRLIIKKVQLEGKKEVDFATFNKVYSIF